MSKFEALSGYHAARSAAARTVTVTRPSAATVHLMDVKGVGEKTFAKWEPFVTVK